MAARSKQVLESFINIYKEETCLWHFKSKEYHNRPKREAAYERLIAKLKEIEPTANKDAVTKKINNLRSSYRKELKKVDASFLWGDEVYQPKLWYFNLLSFLNNQDLQRASCSNSDLEYKALGWQDTNDDDDRSELSATDDFDSVASNPALHKSHTRPPKCFPQNPHIQEDKMDIFAKHIATSLREMSKQQRVLAEKLIGDILFGAQMGTLTISNQEQMIKSEYSRQFSTRVDDKLDIKTGEHDTRSNKIDSPLPKSICKKSMKRKRLNNTEDIDDEDSHEYSHDSASDEVEVDLGLVKEEDVSDEDNEPMNDDESLCVETSNHTLVESQNPNYVPIKAEVLKKAISTVNRLTDDCCIFGDFVASELRSLKSAKLKLKLQSRIQKAILKIAEEDEDLHDQKEQNRD